MRDTSAGWLCKTVAVWGAKRLKYMVQNAPMYINFQFEEVITQCPQQRRQHKL